jgi:tetratricopeptide (TPR) repeat protein
MRSQAAKLLAIAQEVAERGIATLRNTQSIVSAADPTVPPSELELDLTKLLCDVTNSLGTLDLNRGRFDDALQHLQQAVSMRSQLGAVDEELIYMKRNVGIAMLSANRVLDAHKAFEESMSLREQQLSSVDDQNPFRDKLASNYGSLSHSFLAMKNYDEAWAAASRSTELCKQVHAPESGVLSE